MLKVEEMQKLPTFKFGRRMAHLLRSGLLCMKIKLEEENQEV